MNNENDSVFGDYSNYYDLLNQGKNYQEEAHYIFKQIQQYCPNAQHVLELGCGTGIHSNNLLKLKDFIIDGVDLSPQMLKISKEKFQDSRFTPHLGDICTWNGKKKYEFVFSIFHVVSYLTEYNQVLELMKNVSKQLTPDGVFIFDSWFGPGVIRDLPGPRIREVENDHLKIVRNTHSKNLPNQNTTEVTFDITITNKFTDQNQKLTELHPMRYWFTPEIKWAAEQAGLKLEMVKTWLGEKEADYSSWNALFILKKV